MKTISRLVNYAVSPTQYLVDDQERRGNAKLIDLRLPRPLSGHDRSGNRAIDCPAKPLASVIALVMAASVPISLLSSHAHATTA